MLRHIVVVVLCSVAAYGQLECGQKIPQKPWPGSFNVDEVPVGQIVGGRNSYPEHYWPWQLSLQFLRENTTDNFAHTCGATLIDSHWALTAAHCVEARLVGLNDSRREDPANFKLILGANNLADLALTTTRYIDLIIKHERFSPNPYLGFPNDIALLRLTEDAPEGDPNIGFSCIPKQSDVNFTGEVCWITGWGLLDNRDENIPAILQEGMFYGISNEHCKTINFGYIRDSHICAGTGMPNSCSGDSGGPMSCYKEDEGVWYQAGVTSWGSSTCADIPAVYTRVSSFWEWIEVNKAVNEPMP